MTLSRPLLLLTAVFAATAALAGPPAGTPVAPLPGDAAASPLTQFHVAPTRILWQSDEGVANAVSLLAPKPGQVVLSDPLPPCTLTASEGGAAGILIDFGRELQGHVELFTPMAPSQTPVLVRVRFGESASEAMADLGGEQNAQNDHAIRDSVVKLPWLGTKTVGPSGFRFVRIDAIDPEHPVQLAQVRAVLGIRDVPRVGSFRSSDERLNRIWEVGADTVHLCMQDYLWDGIKRDRLVWIGDMHPEVSTIHAVFGFNDVVPRSLDLTRDVTPVEQWMNGISSYSMWWVLIHEDIWMHHGDRDYLAAQQPYLGQLLERLAALVGPDGKERIDGMRFLDWPSSPNQEGVTAGLQGLLVMTLESGSRLMQELGEERVAGLCREAAARAKAVVPGDNGSKSGASLQVLAGMRDAEVTAREVLLPGGASGVSTFYGLYVLEALAEAGETEAALKLIRSYWGGMLDMGATTFWEDFNLAWTENAAPIDELVPKGKADIHGDFGDYCYEGFRHSLCHGWASGPTSWLSRHVLGIAPLEPGFARVRIAPDLGDLAWAEGSYPTPHGAIHVRHERQPDGSIASQVEAPDAISVELVGAVPMTRRGEAGPEEGLAVSQLRCEWLTDPVGVSTASPRLSWIVRSQERAQQQTGSRVLVASDPGLLEPGRADLWDSGMIASDHTLGIEYAGRPLASGQQVFWRVQAADRDHRASSWSEVASFTIGLLTADDWSRSGGSEWIIAAGEPALHADPATLHLPPARHFRKVFTTSKPVRRAVLQSTALGIVDFSLNGRPVSDDLFAPGWNDYHRRVPARTHDVTAVLQGEGPNCLGAVLADGWYAGYVGYGLLVGYGPHRTGRAIYGAVPALRCVLDIEYADGTRERIASDTSWLATRSGPIREADFLMGERHDARDEMPGWDTPAYKPADHWQPALLAESVGSISAPFFESGVKREAELGFVAPAAIGGYAAEPIRITARLPAASVTESSPGVYIFDLGQNIAGVAELAVEAPAGTEIRLRFGEMLHPDGRLMTENLRRARAVDTYICAGSGLETWSPRFTYHGFQYVEVTGLPAGTVPTTEMITGLVLHNDTPLVGSFACSDELLTRFWKNTQWTQRGNFIEVPTDCPQRDERLGWMGDAQIYARTASFNADVAAFFTKWIADVREAQVASGPEAGAYPDYAPYPFAHGKPGAVFGTAWTDAGVICPWTMWQVYDDTRLVAEHWASMELFMEWRLRRDPELVGVETGNTWGDWLNVNETTPIPYVDLCFHAWSAQKMAEMAEALGKPERAAFYRERYAGLAESFAGQFRRDDGSVSVDTQTACVLALETGLVAGDDAGPVVRQLVERIEANDVRMATGFLGTKSILPALSAHGHHDLACRLFQSREFPSWGYEVEQGANTVWERWDSFTKEHGFEGFTGSNNAAMNSFSHYAFGAVMEWGYRTLAGIDLLEPGYRTIRIRPLIPSAGSNPDREPISWVRADYDSPRGLIASHWRREGEQLVMEIVIPANTTAEVHVPAASLDDVSCGGQQFSAGPAEGVEVREVTDTAAILSVGSGEYRFTSRLP
ncbi:MAG: family 78 glycoside hydrolase catalytic domain [Pirellulales bacterium]|nr:family 78 glycoside hydrolase catalytic domain [Pirellulales bacterium]